MVDKIVPSVISSTSGGLKHRLVGKELSIQHTQLLREDSGIYARGLPRVVRAE